MFALAALFAPVALAQIREIKMFPFPDDKINATLTVNFEGYNSPHLSPARPSLQCRGKLS
jgi:hypothetical protein